MKNTCVSFGLLYRRAKHSKKCVREFYDVFDFLSDVHFHFINTFLILDLIDFIVFIKTYIYSLLCCAASEKVTVLNTHSLNFY